LKLKHYTYSYYIDYTEHVGVEVALWTCIQVVLGSNLGGDTGYPDRKISHVPPARPDEFQVVVPSS
jgi:hypothetical protein